MKLQTVNSGLTIQVAKKNCFSGAWYINEDLKTDVIVTDVHRK